MLLNFNLGHEDCGLSAEDKNWALLVATLYFVFFSLLIIIYIYIPIYMIQINIIRIYYFFGQTDSSNSISSNSSNNSSNNNSNNNKKKQKPDHEETQYGNIIANFTFIIHLEILRGEHVIGVGLEKGSTPVAVRGIRFQYVTNLQ
ncbi:hypothetical protein ACJX0J_014634 [Zea mays]